NGGCGGLAYCSYANKTKRPDVLMHANKLLEEKTHTVDAGEDQPLVAAELGQYLGECFEVHVFPHLNEWEFQNARTLRFEFLAPFGRLFAWTGDNDATTSECGGLRH